MPRFILENFTTNIHDKNGGVQRHVWSSFLKKQNVFHQSPLNVIYRKRMYDIDSDNPVKLENNFDNFLEKPMSALIRKISDMASSKYGIVLTRHEVEFLKKYMLIQRYRTPANMESYKEAHTRFAGLLNPSFCDRTSGLKIWKDNVDEILRMSWEDLFDSNNLEIKDNVIGMQNESLVFLKSRYGFTINDRGYVAECVPATLSEKDVNNIIRDISREYVMDSNEINVLSEEFMKMAKCGFPVLTLYPLSPELAVVSVNTYWVYFFGRGFPMLGYYDSILSGHMSLPEKLFKDRSIYKDILNMCDSDSSDEERRNSYDAYRSKWSPDDLYAYRVDPLDIVETARINSLMINEAQQIVFRGLDEMFFSSFIYEISGMMNKRYELSRLMENLRNMAHQQNYKKVMN